MSLTAGIRLGPYEILAPIGAGGMGEVYRARDTQLDRDVAIKVLPEAFANHPDRMTRFIREAKVLAALNHPNIAQIYGLEQGALVMELVEGETLAGPLPLETALNYARQIADALEAAHEKGIVHRDLKPGNIMITAAGVIKVLDFGLAAVVQAPDAGSSDQANTPTLVAGATQAGVILGTVGYMSPEQARGKQVDKRADIWAFGVVLYEMLTGRELFEGKEVSDILAAVIRDEPRWEGIPVKVRRLLKRCLEKDPKRRLRDIGDAWELLEDAPGSARQTRVLVYKIASGVFALGLAALAFLHFREAPPAAEVVRFQIPPLDATRRAFTAPVLSPDGRKVAFFDSYGATASDMLWVRALDTLEARSLPGTEDGGWTPVWSPDSRSLAFLSGSIPNPNYDLKRVELAGGPPQTLASVTRARRPGSGVPSLAWSREGVIVFPQDGSGLLRVPAAGGAISPVTTLDSSRGESAHTLPAFLPDGRHFVYLRVSSRPENTGLYVGSLEAKPEQQSLRRLLPEETGVIYAPSANASKGHLLFLRAGTLMAQPFDAGRLELTGDAVPIAEQVGTIGPRGGDQVSFFSASASGALAYRTGRDLALIGHLAWFDRQGKALGTLGEPLHFFSPLALSPDGAQVAFSRGDASTPSGPAASSARGNIDIWLHEFARGTSTRFTFDPARDLAPVWSPDGSHIIFASERDGASNLYQKGSSGAGNEVPLLKSSEGKTPTDWSRDGRFLLYTVQDPKTLRDLWVLPLGGAEGNRQKPAPYLKTAANEANGRFSPDSRFVAYRSNASGSDEIYVQPFPDAASGKWMISKGGGALPRWRRDGKELFYVAPDRTLMVVAVTSSPVFKAGVPTALFRLPSWAPGGLYDVTGDGLKFITFAQDAPAVATAAEPITVVLNWAAGLRK